MDRLPSEHRTGDSRMSSLDLALIGNCSYGALVNAMGEVVWACMPRFDSEPVFCSLFRARDRPDDFGFYAIDLLDVARAEQHYLVNTAVLVTRLYDARDGETVDASLLLLHEMGFVGADDPRFAGTVAAIEQQLRRGNFIFRYLEQDDFGIPENAFTICTFWYIDALAALGRCEEARALFETLLTCRNHHGLLSEDTDPNTRELWGNFAQTYSMVGLINSAMRLSKPWEEAF